jgi:hypothetical protein
MRPAFSWLLDGLFRRILLLEKNRFVAVTFGEGEVAAANLPSVSLAPHFVFKGVDVTQGGMCWALSQVRREIFIDMVWNLPPRALPVATVTTVTTATTAMTAAVEQDGAKVSEVPYDTRDPRVPYRLALTRSHIMRRIRQWVTSLHQHTVPTEHFVITQRLSQPLEAYDDDAVRQHGHVQAARLLHAAGFPLVGTDQPIEYVRRGLLGCALASACLVPPFHPARYVLGCL